MNYHNTVVADGIYHAQGGALRAAERDRFVKTYLTKKGMKIFLDAYREFEAYGNEAVLADQVAKAVAAGY